MKIAIDVEDPEALYLQIAQTIKQQLAVGDRSPGERLPPVRQVARQNGINFNTVARAYRLLEEEGWLTTRQGRGTFVTEILPDEGLQPFQKQLHRRLTRNYLSRMRGLGCSREEIIQLITELPQGKTHAKNKNPKE